MSAKSTAVAVVSLLLLLAPAAAGGEARQAPLFDDLGRHHHAITTKSAEAQRYFDQGLILVYGFNHAEAVRSFREAARLDPDAAMPHWGIALALGPNINAPMSDEAVPQAYAAVRRAVELADGASDRERDYIRALEKRYSAEPVKDRSALDRAYADAMRQVAGRHPDDPDAATLMAEALMDTMPWDYWTPEGKPRPGTQEALDALEAVLRRHPDHPGANHYLIHLVEASPNPERGLAAAHRLADLAPGAGHLVHMPSHIYLRLGLYHEASQANERAIRADESYLTQCRRQGFYPALYYSHNMHFLSHTTAVEGRSADALAAAGKTAEHLKHHDLSKMPFMQWMRATPLMVRVRFGRWDDILAEPAPAEGALFEQAMWRYARGRAFVGKRDADKAAAESKALSEIASSREAETLQVRDLPGASIVRLADQVMAAESAGLRGDTEGRLRGLRDAVAAEDALPYMEPPFWEQPVRQLLGSALLEAGRPAEAEAVYREDLRRHPRTGWSLFGLLESLRRQGRTAEAAEVQDRLRRAWTHADVVLTGSTF